MLKIDISRQAAKFLKGLPPKHGQQVAVKMMQLREDWKLNASIQMKGKASVYRRVDVGEYRIVYRVEGDTLQIVLVGKRNDEEIYRRLARK